MFYEFYTQTLTLWAFPQKCQSYNDALVCCVKHNPNPVVYPITCTGVEPEIRFDCKQLDFKKVLLHRLVNCVLSSVLYMALAAFTENRQMC